jgi:hypothetical protein
MNVPAAASSPGAAAPYPNANANGISVRSAAIGSATASAYVHHVRHIGNAEGSLHELPTSERIFSGQLS